MSTQTYVDGMMTDCKNVSGELSNHRSNRSNNTNANSSKNNGWRDSRRSPPTCAFTDRSSSPLMILRDCYCNGSSKDDESRRCVTFVLCPCCIDSKRIWRCVDCYRRFQQAIVSDRAAHRMVSIPVIKFLLTTDWDNDLIHTLKENDFVSVTRSPYWNNEHFSLVWKQGCPTCVDCHFPPPRPLIATSFSSVMPRLFSRRLIEIKAPSVSAENGLLSVVAAHVLIYSFHPVAEDSFVSHFQFRTADDDHQKYYNVSADAIAFLSSRGLLDSKVWVVTLGADTDEKCNNSKNTLLSMMLFNGLTNTIASCKNDYFQISRRLLLATREGTFAKKGKTIALPTYRKQIKASLLKSEIRVSRKSGAFGNANGCNLAELRKKCMKQNVQGAFPRREPATICIPYFYSQSSDLITELIPFYVCVKGSSPKIVKRPHNAIPRYGWKISSRKIAKALQGKVDPVDDAAAKVLAMETSVTYTGALIMQQVAIEYPEFAASSAAINNAIQSYICAIKKEEEEPHPLGVLGHLWDLEEGSVVVEPTFAHKDKHRSDRKEVMESKIVLLFGSKSTETYPASVICSAFPGALCYPRYKVLTVARALQDIELHCLIDEVHMSQATSNTTRGGWFYARGNMHFYPQCVALTCWDVDS